MFITSVDGMPRPSPLLSCRPNVHFFIVEAVESRYGQRAAYTDETRKFLFAHTPPQKRSAADNASQTRKLILNAKNQNSPRFWPLYHTCPCDSPAPFLSPSWL